MQELLEQKADVLVNKAVELAVAAMSEPFACAWIWIARVYRRRWADELRSELDRRVSLARRLCRPHPQGGEARGPAGPAIDEVRARHQRRDRQDARPHRAAVAARHCRRGDRVKRREFVTLLGGTAATWPLAALAQQDRMRRIGVLMNLAESDPESQIRIAAFRQGLGQLGWTESSQRSD
jgi:hypothetical protein